MPGRVFLPGRKRVGYDDDDGDFYSVTLDGVCGEGAKFQKYKIFEQFGMLPGGGDKHGLIYSSTV